MPVNIGVNIQRSPNRINQQLREAGVEGKFPKLLLDFKDQYYLASGGSKTLANAVTHARSGNAVMTDGYGPELVTNGGFTGNADNWTLVNSTYRDNAVDVSTTSAVFPLSQTGTTAVSGKSYVVTFQIRDYQGSGAIKPSFGGVDGTFRSANGYHTEVITATGTGYLLFKTGGTAFTGTIDSVSVREMPVLKWAPHNLVTYSEEFGNAAWSKTRVTVTANNITAPDGSLTADKLVVDSNAGSHFARINATTNTGDLLTLAVFAKAAEYDYIAVYAGTTGKGKYFDLSSGSILGDLIAAPNDARITDVGDGWYLCEIDVTTTGNEALSVYLSPNGSSYSFTGDGSSGVYLWGAHLYRSDLGGMVDNPERGDSYVPTTSTAVYLPRIGHHVYNGSAWVNEGLLAESEARTNVVNYSNDFTVANWSKSNVTATSAAGISPDGNNNAFKVSETTATSVHIISNAGSATACYSVFAKAGTNTRFRINSGSSGNGYATFNLSDGTIIAQGGTALVDVTMQDYGNGWYRCALALDSSATSTFSIVLEDPSGNVNYTGNTANHIFVYGAQVESNVATPSSYIPTTDTTDVTRSAETFTIPSANLPWPSPSYIGSELVTNGDFATDSDWTKSDFTISGGQASTSSGTTGSIDQAISFVSGKVYELSVDVVSISGGSASIQARGVSTVASTIDGGDSGKTHKFIYADTANNTTLRVYAGSGTNLTIDNISVREINPLSVSIAMDGRMTYADTNSGEEVVFVNWFADTNNKILERVRTNVGTGDFTTQQSASGTADTVSSGGSIYTPNVLVPFNIAARHGSTFINGATDGVAFTANTTPTALPDLSATDLSLVNDYMGTIGTFRVWDRDIADTGLVEATNPSLEPSLSLTFEGAGTNSFIVNDWAE